MQYATQHGKGRDDTPQEILSRQPFNAGNVSGMAFAGSPGDMPEPWRSEYRETRTTAYTVYSYATPIAWYDSERAEWVVPDIRYSASTSQHQSLVRYALRDVPVEDKRITTLESLRRAAEVFA